MHVERESLIYCLLEFDIGWSLPKILCELGTNNLQREIPSIIHLIPLDPMTLLCELDLYSISVSKIVPAYQMNVPGHGIRNLQPKEVMETYFLLM